MNSGGVWAHCRKCSAHSRKVTEHSGDLPPISLKLPVCSALDCQSAHEFHPDRNGVIIEVKVRGVQRWEWRAGSGEPKCPIAGRNMCAVERKVLAAHDRGGQGVDAFGSEGFAGDLLKARNGTVIIGSDRVAAQEFAACLATVGTGNAFGDFSDAAFQHGARCFAERSVGALQERSIRNDVECASGFNHRDADNG